MYSFNLCENPNRNKPDDGKLHWEYDYMIMVFDESGNDNIGSHIPEVDSVLSKLGIEGEDSENLFSGFYDEDRSSLEEIKNYLVGSGWLFDQKIDIYPIES